MTWYHVSNANQVSSEIRVLSFVISCSSYSIWIETFKKNYYQGNKEKLQKRSREYYRNLSKNDRTKKDIIQKLEIRTASLKPYPSVKVLDSWKTAKMIFLEVLQVVGSWASNEFLHTSFSRILITSAEQQLKGNSSWVPPLFPPPPYPSLMYFQAQNIFIFKYILIFRKETLDNKEVRLLKTSIYFHSIWHFAIYYY